MTTRSAGKTKIKDSRRKKNPKIKAVILCGGQGSRIRDVSEILPKPMLSIGEKPILWHIMKTYAHHGIHDFVLCLGYKGWIVKEFFLNYFAKTSDLSLTLGNQNSVTYHNAIPEAHWNITLVDTGEATQTGARVWNVRHHLEDCDLFSLTYGDGVADVDVSQLVETHLKSGLTGTVTAVHPSGRFGEIVADDKNHISEFNEKPNVSQGMINGGFMLFNKKVLNRYFSSDEKSVLEKDVLPLMVEDRELGIYKHDGFWQCMDTPREYAHLNQLWNEEKAPWKVWE